MNKMALNFGTLKRNPDHHRNFYICFNTSNTNQIFINIDNIKKRVRKPEKHKFRIIKTFL